MKSRTVTGADISSFKFRVFLSSVCLPDRVSRKYWFTEKSFAMQSWDTLQWSLFGSLRELISVCFKIESLTIYYLFVLKPHHQRDRSDVLQTLQKNQGCLWSGYVRGTHLPWRDTPRRDPWPRVGWRVGQGSFLTSKIQSRSKVLLVSHLRSREGFGTSVCLAWNFNTTSNIFLKKMLSGIWRDDK